MRTEQEESSGVFVEMVTELAHQVEILRETIDELRDELTYELRKLRDAVAEPIKPFRLTSMPRDPCAPDFHARVNAVQPEQVVATSETPAQLLNRLLRAVATRQLTADDWDSEQEFTPDETVEIDSESFDWFAENFAAVHQGPEHFVADDSSRGRYLVWCRDERCYVRLLTPKQQDLLEELAESELPASQKSNPPNGDSSTQPSRSTQQSLW